jgi:hypothetical protein
LLRSLPNWLGRIVDERDKEIPPSFMDIGTNSSVLFDEIQRLGLFDSSHASHPLPGLEAELNELNVQSGNKSLTYIGAITALQ